MKSITIFTVFFLFLAINIPAHPQSLGEHRMKQIVAGEILKENTEVLKFFRSLTIREQDLLNSALQENYIAGYYAEICQTSQDPAFGEHLSKAEERLRMIREGGLYETILYKTKDATKAHLLRYIVRRYEAGTIHGGAVAATSRPIHTLGFFNEDKYWDGLFFGKVYAQISEEYWAPLDPKEVFPVVKEGIKKKKTSVRPKGAEINWSALGKFFLVGTLILLVTAAIIVLIGACCCPALPIFKQVRALLEQ